MCARSTVHTAAVTESNIKTVRMLTRLAAVTGDQLLGEGVGWDLIPEARSSKPRWYRALVPLSS